MPHPSSALLAELEAIQQLQQLCDESSAIANHQLVPKLFEPVSAADPSCFQAFPTLTLAPSVQQKHA
jgi:hypothetical protein